ncbi:MAG: cell envelope integrity protein TolA, partial [Betaproteobacteria bacterium]
KEAEQKKLAEEKTRKEVEIKKAAEETARKEAEEKKLAEEKRLTEEKARKEAEAKKAAEEKKIAEARQRAEDEKRRQHLVDAERARAAQLLSQGAGSGTSGSAAAGDGAAMATWGGQIKALIRDAPTYSAAGSANPEARFRIRLSPPPTAPATGDMRDCRVVDVQLTRSSGEQAWDRAAEQAIRKSSPWPRMPNGSCPGDAIEITQRPRD